MITDYGGGLERYNLIVNNYTKASTLLGMKRMMESLRYSRAYPSSANPANWYTEFVGVRDLTVASPVSDYEPVMDIVSEYYEREPEQTAKLGTPFIVPFMIFIISNYTYNHKKKILRMCLNYKREKYRLLNERS